MTGDREFRAFDAFVVLLLALLLLIGLSSVLPQKALVFANAALPAAAVLGAWLRRRSPANLFSPGRITLGLASWTVLGTVAIFVVMTSLVEPFLDMFPRNYEQEIQELKEEILDIPPLLAWILLVGFAPLCEEAFFRGAILRGLRTSWGTLAGIVASSLLFGVFHVLPPRIVATFLIGLWLGALAVRSGGLAAPVLAHALNNSLVLTLSSAELDHMPIWMAAPGGAALLLAAWRLFGARSREMQGSAPSGPS